MTCALKQATPLNQKKGNKKFKKSLRGCFYFFLHIIYYAKSMSLNRNLVLIFFSNVCVTKFNNRLDASYLNDMPHLNLTYRVNKHLVMVGLSLTSSY